MRPLLLALALIAQSSWSAPRLIAPPDLSAPAPAPVRVTGLPPGAAVVIRAERRTRDGALTYVAHARYVADRRGRVDTRIAVARDGTYAGADALGLFWSGIARPARAGDGEPGQVRLTVSLGRADVATATARTGAAADAVVAEGATPFPGAVWERPVAPGRHPVIIVLGGSEGGNATATALAPLIATRGYAVLGLPYYDPGYGPAAPIAGLPRSFTDIPVDRLLAVRAWLATQPAADARRIGLWGASKGAEYALIAASRYRWVRAVAAIVPTDVVWEGWGGAGPPTASFALDGRPLPFLPYVGMGAELTKAARGEAMDLRRVHLAGRAAFPARLATARIPIERFRGPLLLAGGGRDQIWPSAEMATAIAATRVRAGRPTQLLVFAGANHFLGGPGTDPALALATPGVSPATIAHARAETWRATFALFARALR